MDPIVFPNVSLGVETRLDLFVIVGKPPRDCGDGELETIIGDKGMIRSHTVIYAGNKIGANFQTGHQVMVRENNIIGDNVSIGTGSVIEHHVRIEDDVRIHSQAFIPEYCVLRQGAWVGPNVVLTNAKYPNRDDTKKNLAGVVLEKNAVIGANATLLPGITIGESAVIGAGSVVVRDVPPHATAYGNPAQIHVKNMPTQK